jgi:hypothetical protein
MLYLISFFLPAVLFEDHFLSGWRCAFLTLRAWLTGGLVDPAYQLGARLSIFGGPNCVCTQKLDTSRNEEQNLPTEHWIDRFAYWLELQGWLKK